MSVKIMGEVWDADLPRPEKFVLLSYADHAAHDGTNVYPSVGRMAWKTGYTKRSIQKITAKLIDMGILVQVGTRDSGVKKYWIDCSKLPNRNPYRGGEVSSPPTPSEGVKKTQGGAKKTADRGEKSSPEPSLTTKEQPSDLTPHQEMFGRLADLCQIDLDLITDSDRGKLNRVSKKLVDAGKTPKHIDRFKQYWYEADWRGKQGQPPGPYDVTKEWGRAKEWLNGGSNGRNRSRSTGARGSSQASRGRYTTGWEGITPEDAARHNEERRKAEERARRERREREAALGSD